MSTTATTSVEHSDVVETQVAETAIESQSAVLITEEEVVFGTAAAIPVQPTRIATRWLAAVRQMVAGLKANDRPKRRYYPRNYGFLEASCMSRAMDRL